MEKATYKTQQSQRLSASLNNALECQDYDDVEVLVDRIEESEQEVARLGYVLASEMQDDGSYKATCMAADHPIRNHSTGIVTFYETLKVTMKSNFYVIKSRKKAQSHGKKTKIGYSNWILAELVLYYMP